MKRFFAIGSAIVLASAFLVLAVAMTRPTWLPEAVRTRLSPFSAVGISAKDDQGHGHDDGHGHGSSEDAGLFCKEHGVPEKYCTLCHQELTESLDLCAEHGNLPEAICTKCNPEAADSLHLEMCPKGHGFPREFCQTCGKATSALALLPDDGWCATHNVPEELCVECQLDPATRTRRVAGTQVCRQPLPLVKLKSAKLARQVGIETTKVVEEEHSHTLKANAETAYDGNHFAEITPRVTGVIREVSADLGKVVKQGEVLAVVDSAEVSASKAQFITMRGAVSLAQATYDRTHSLARTGSLPAKAELEALTALNQAKASALDAEQKLRNFGFGGEELERITAENDIQSRLNVLAPLDGVVVVRHAVKGEPIQATTPIFSVADTSKVWLWIDVYESEIASIHLGQQVEFTISGNDAPASTGTLNWVGTEVNPQTRTTRVRAELANPKGRLRANQFGRAEIRIGEPHKALVVPKAAVQRKDKTELVFIPDSRPGVYRPQRVVTKPTDDSDRIEVVWGLKAGQVVVSKGAFLLKTEIMKGAIGAGCCE